MVTTTLLCLLTGLVVACWSAWRLRGAMTMGRAVIVILGGPRPTTPKLMSGPQPTVPKR